uniref:Uncharacterized protein n=1 Tax=Ditylenchus dipsaci TaxID=166011 RepID=A0A915DWU9_9BILA
MTEPASAEVKVAAVSQQSTEEMLPREKTAEEKSMLDRLNTIHDDGEKIDKTLIAKLVDSYDGLKVQEDEFICMLKKLAGIEDSAPAVTAPKKESTKNDADEDFDYEEAHKTLGEAEKMAEQASAAASINQQLQTQIALNQQKKSALAHVHNNKSQQKGQEASKALQEVEFSKLKLASESESVDRKQRQLERLRKEAAKRGYIGKTGDQQNKSDKKRVEELLVKPVVVSAGQEDSEVKAADTVEHSKDFKKDEFHARISERFAAFEARKQRMRQLRSRLNQFEEQKMDDAYGQAIDRLQNLTTLRKQLESMQAAETPPSSESVKALSEEVNQLADVSSSSPSSREKSNVNEFHSSKKSSQELDSAEDGSVTTDEVGYFT